MVVKAGFATALGRPDFSGEKMSRTNRLLPATPV